MARVSQVAGIDLVPHVDWEIANINVSASYDQSTETEENTIDDFNDRPSTVTWHFDSFPFVCVTMLSDCTGMVGGETAMRTPTGDVIKVRGPAMVCHWYTVI